jgi:hypothetical protein
MSAPEPIRYPARIGFQLTGPIRARVLEAARRLGLEVEPLTADAEHFVVIVPSPRVAYQLGVIVGEP